MRVHSIGGKRNQSLLNPLDPHSKWGVCDTPHWGSLLVKRRLHRTSSREGRLPDSFAEWPLSGDALNATIRFAAGAAVIAPQSTDSTGREEWYQQAPAAAHYTFTASLFPTCVSKAF